MARLEAYEFGRVTFDGVTYVADLLILAGRVVADWWREDSHALAVADLWELEQECERPAILVVGTGAYGRLAVDEETQVWLRGLGIGLHAAPTAEAVGIFNALEQRGVRVAAALHLTC